MRAHLLSPAHDFAVDAPEPPFSDDLAADLQLDYLWDAMAGGDAFLRAVARAGLLHPVRDLGEIRYRQEALADCAAGRDAVRELYDLAVEAVELPRHGFLMLRAHGRPELVLARALRLLAGLADLLDRFRRRCAELTPLFSSRAFRGLFATIAHELDDEQMRLIRQRIAELSFRRGLLMSAGVGVRGEVTHQVLRLPKEENRGLFDRTPMRRPRYSFTLAPRDEAGFAALGELRDRSINDVADAAAQSADHVLSFFGALRAELGFFLASLNLADALGALGAPMCTPDPSAEESTRASGLYDPCLALRMGRAPVGNDVAMGRSGLLVVTGANRGGKSTLLRALGTAQLMVQAGMLAPATRFDARPVGAVFSHWAREEDGGLQHGKLDEELDRMGRIVRTIRSGDLLLCNESFASTNEAEGSQILWEVTCALRDAGVQVRSVTHLYEFAHAVAADAGLDAVFLRAPRAEDGRRSFRLEPGGPLRTSYGLDLYDQTFGTDLAAQG
ncbi:MAG: hypothetical protein QM626_11785 [Microbacterium sp.]|uniref:MutS-related protein n=1 Tax=Microbacterium sp. TaxID=51671 RepID=UPI0039E6BCE9